MLIGNYSVLYRTPARLIGGAVGNDAAAFKSSGRMRNVYSAASWSDKSGIPDGVRAPYAWLLPLKAGGLASRYIIMGTGSLTASGALGRNMGGALTGSGTLTGAGALIVSAAAALTGSGSITTADLLAILQATAALTGSGSITAADLEALGWMLADLAGEGEVEGVSYAIGNMLADIQPFTDLSPQALAAAVWSTVAADANDPGTMGEKVNDAGSASNPWTEVIEDNYTAAELLRIMAAALAGELSGVGTTTITIKGVDQTTDRIIATVTSEGERTAVALDGG